MGNQDKLALLKILKWTQDCLEKGDAYWDADRGAFAYGYLKGGLLSIAADLKELTDLGDDPIDSKISEIILQK